jgi:hypothetical protein
MVLVGRASVPAQVQIARNAFSEDKPGIFKTITFVSNWYQMSLLQNSKKCRSVKGNCKVMGVLSQ